MKQRPVKQLKISAICVMLATAGIVGVSNGVVAQNAKDAEQTESNRLGNFAKSKPEEKGSQKALISAWTVNCSDGVGGQFLCAMSQTLISGKTRRPLASLVLQKQPTSKQEKSSDILWIRVAHGVFLPAGVVAQIDDDKPVRLPFIRSEVKGVFAPYRLSPELLKKLKSGKVVQLQLALAGKKQIKLSAPLEGFAKAYDRISKI